MLQFKQDATSAELILTLSEKVSINDPYYLFVFTHVLTKSSIIFIKSEGDDDSVSQGRYNRFTINPSVVFLDQPTGEWHYKIYEQASSTNTDLSLTGAVLEYGKMRLDRATDFAFVRYNETTAYKAYDNSVIIGVVISVGGTTITTNTVLRFYKKVLGAGLSVTVLAGEHLLANINGVTLLTPAFAVIDAYVEIRDDKTVYVEANIDLLNYTLIIF